MKTNSDGDDDDDNGSFFSMFLNCGHVLDEMQSDEAAEDQVWLTGVILSLTGGAAAAFMSRGNKMNVSHRISC